MAQHRPNVRESSMVSSLDRRREQEHYHAMSHLRENIDQIAEQLTIKLIETGIVETSNKGNLEGQIRHQLETFLEADEFDIQYQVANIRNVVPLPNPPSLFVTAFIVEKLLSYDWIVDIFGTDEEIYRIVNAQVIRTNYDSVSGEEGKRRRRK